MAQGDSACVDRMGNEKLESRAMERDLCVLANGKLYMSQQCLGNQEGHCHPGGHQSQHCWLGEGGNCPLCSGVVSPPGGSFGHRNIRRWSSKCPKRGVIRMMKGLEEKPYKEQLRSLGLFSWEKGKPKGDLTAGYNFLMRWHWGADPGLCSFMTTDRARGMAGAVSGEV